MLAHWLIQFRKLLEIDDANIQPPPSIGTRYRSEFIEGIAKVDEEFIMILNMDLIFSTDELNLLKESFDEGQEENVK